MESTRRSAAENPYARCPAKPGAKRFGRTIVHRLGSFQRRCGCRNDGGRVGRLPRRSDLLEELERRLRLRIRKPLVKGGGTIDYPYLKLKINRLANFFLRVLFRIQLNDTTNAFKAYRRAVIDGCRPFLSPHFNLTIEIPLKAIVRGYSWKVVPITWRNRRSGAPKLKIKEMGSRYLFICLYVWLPKYFSRCFFKESN